MEFWKQSVELQEKNAPLTLVKRQYSLLTKCLLVMRWLDVNVS